MANKDRKALQAGLAQVFENGPGPDMLAAVVASDQQRSGRPAPTQPVHEVLTQVSKDLSKPVSTDNDAELDALDGEDAELTQVSNYLSTRLSSDLSKSSGGRVSKGSRERPLTQPVKSPRKQPPNQPFTQPDDDFLTQFAQAHVAEPLVRMSVDPPRSLHARIKRFCNDTGIPSGRAFAIAAMERILKERGY